MAGFFSTRDQCSPGWLERD